MPRAAGAVLSVMLIAACTVNPPPAPQSTETTQQAAPAPKAAQIIVAIDAIGPGFNPHLLSDLSPVNAAISALVLPSSFRPVPDPASATGSRWDLNPTLLVSADVTGTSPFTVTYKIRPEAAWTDNAPIAADDFWYLWRQMVSQPGVVDPAGYDLITGVQSMDGGKTAVVTFSRPTPPGGSCSTICCRRTSSRTCPAASRAGCRTLPVTGGQFRADTIDPQRDEILLARNDRYWGPPAKPDQILFRRAGATAALADSIRNGDTQVAQVHGGAAAFAQLSAIPEVRTSRVVTPRTLQLTLRGQLPKLADPVVRQAILGLLDVDLLAAVGAGSDNSVTLDQALVRAPSDPGYMATAPVPLGKERALALFAQAGFQVDRSGGESPIPPLPPGPGAAPRHRRRPPVDASAGTAETLTLVIGAAANDPTSVAVANTAADQLRSVGIAATVLALEPPVLYGPALVTNRVDAIVGWRAAGGDLATALASRFGCPALEATAVPVTPAPSPPASPAPRRPAAPGPAPEAAPLVRAPSNLTGICDRAIQPKIDGALAGSLNISAVINAVEPRLWAMATVLPIIQDTTIVAAGPSVASVSLSGGCRWASWATPATGSRLPAEGYRAAAARTRLGPLTAALTAVPIRVPASAA